MKQKANLTRLTAILLACAMALLGLQPTTATAANGHQPLPGPTLSTSVGPSTGVGPKSDGAYCQAYLAPDIQLDTSSPRRLHYGVRIWCTFIDTALTATIRVYKIEGTGDNERYVLEDTKTVGPAVISAIGNSWPLACTGTTTSRWIASDTGSSGIMGALVPAVGWGPVHTYDCALTPCGKPTPPSHPPDPTSAGCSPLSRQRTRCTSCAKAHPRNRSTTLTIRDQPPTGWSTSAQQTAKCGSVRARQPTSTGRTR